MTKKRKELEDNHTSWKIQAQKPFKIQINKAGSNYYNLPQNKKNRLILKQNSQSRRYHSQLSKIKKNQFQTRTCPQEDNTPTPQIEFSPNHIGFPSVFVNKTLSRREATSQSTRLKSFIKKVTFMKNIRRNRRNKKSVANSGNQDLKDLEFDTSFSIDCTIEEHSRERAAEKPPIPPPCIQTPKIMFTIDDKGKDIKTYPKIKGLNRKLTENLKQTRSMGKVHKASVNHINFSFNKLPLGMEKSYKKRISELQLNCKQANICNRTKLNTPSSKSISIFKTVIGSPFSSKCETCKRSLRKNQYKRCCIKSQVKIWKRGND
ncbi:unnamed protein product [Moneuplotes crassus]|uniref:Uncharacterized protein n=1 Tax=Euplotes crassus TaxID=5936 RepID=A0AAD1UQ38_EUPCR|nr:unnamed protein product [Moneuplotes crassus]